jgi:hypothetical protein
MSKNLIPTVPAVLLGAAQLLRGHGWTAGRHFAADGRMCLVGAIRRYVGATGLDSVVQNNLATGAEDQVTRTIWELPGGSATAWNDRRCSSAEEAIEVLERAARVSP